MYDYSAKYGRRLATATRSGSVWGFSLGLPTDLATVGARLEVFSACQSARPGNEKNAETAAVFLLVPSRR